jgi:hypothetical protein
MSKLNVHFQIPYPTFIEKTIVYFLLRHRKKQYGYEFRRIKLTKGQYATVDVEDYPKLASDDWQLYESESKNFYAVRLNKNKIVKMHREIMNNPVGVFVDHINGDGLDNRKKNLRIATRTQNQCNRKKTSAITSSKYKGVHLCRKRNKYRAIIGCSGKRIFLGYFDNETDAAKAYDEAAKKYHGEFAKLNFSDEGRKEVKAYRK